MDKGALITFATALVAILNPLGNVVIFTGMVADRSVADRRAIAVKTAIAVALILVLTVWAGEFVLGLFGVGISSLQVAGGVMIVLISLSMLQSSQSAIHDTKHGTEASAADIAVVPLAMPIIAGPGAMVTVIVNTHQNNGVIANLEMSIVCIAAAALIGICLVASGPITRHLGAEWMDVVTKLMGVLLLSIAVGMLATGLKGLLPGLAG